MAAPKAKKSAVVRKLPKGGTIEEPIKKMLTKKTAVKKKK